MRGRRFRLAVKSVVAAAIIFLFALKFFGDTSRSVVSSTDLLDSGWEYGLARLPDWNLALGKDVFFTYGPLASKLPSLIASGDVRRETTIHFRYALAAAVIYLFYLWVLLRLYRVHPAYTVMAAVAFLLNPFSAGINDPTVYATTALLTVLFFRHCSGEGGGKNLILLVISVFTALAFLYKVSWGIAGFFAVMLSIMCVSLRKNFLFLKYSLISLFLFAVFSFSFYWSITAGSFKDFVNFVIHSAEQSGLYSQMMAVSPYKPEPVTFAWIIISTLIVLCVFYKPSRIPLLLVLPPLFASFKAGFVRADVHMAFFFNSVTLILLSIPLAQKTEGGEIAHNFFTVVRRPGAEGMSIFSEVRFTRNLLPLTVMLLTLALTFWANKIMFQRGGFDLRKGVQTAAAYSRYGVSGYLESGMKESNDNLEAISKIFEPDIKRKVKGQKVASIPWALAVPDALGARAIVFPSLQFYSGYTEKLDEANLNFLKSLSGSAYLLMNFASVDCRYPLHDCPRTYEWLLANYRVLDSSHGYLLLARKDEQSKVVAGEPVFAGRGTEIDFSDADVGAGKDEQGRMFLRLVVKDLVSVKYSIRTLLLRAPALFVEMELSDGKRYRFRTFPEFLRRGVWISPFLRDESEVILWTEGKQELLVRPVKIRIKGEGSGYFNSQPAVYLQRCIVK